MYLKASAMSKRIVWIVALAASLLGQSIIPTKAGLVSYADEAYINDRMVEISGTHFFVVNDNEVLRTGAGRAEVLLGPCAAMWIDENSSFRMISAGLDDIRMEMLSGSMIVAAGAMVKTSKVTLLLKGWVATLRPEGAYRFDAEPPRVKVMAGRATMRAAQQRIRVMAGRWLPLDGTTYAGKPGKRAPDPMDAWSDARAAYLARLAAPLTGHVPETAPPATPDDMDAVRTTVRDRLPRPSTQVPAGSTPNPPRSGCGVAPW